jgi:hypothetical protein
VSERAETYLRLLAEAAVRTAPQARNAAVPADQVRRAADILVDAGAIDDGRATEILLTLGTALRVRGVSGAYALGRAVRLASRLAGPRPGQAAQPPTPSSPAPGRPAPAQRTRGAAWKVIQEAPLAGQVTGSRVMALIVTGDRMIAPATLRFPPSAGLAELSLPSFADLTASDDAGTSYQLSFTDGAWAGSTWTGTIMLRPAPPAAARLLTLVSPHGPVLLIDLSPASVAPQARASLQPVDDSPGERLLHRRAEGLLGSLSRPAGERADPLSPEHRSQAMAQVLHSLSTSVPTTAPLPSGVHSGPPPRAVVMRGTSDPEPDLAELVVTLESAGALSPLSAVPAEVAALGQALGVPRFATFTGPAVTGTASGPAATATTSGSTTSGSTTSGSPAAAGTALDSRAAASLPKLPARWATVLAYYGRRHQPSLPSGTGSVGAVLPEVDGAQFVVAGARTGAQGTVLYVIARGLRTMTPPAQDTGFSWWARDESGGWHLGVVQGWHLANDTTALRLTLLPPLRPGEPGTASFLTLEVTGPGHRLTASLRACW